MPVSSDALQLGHIEEVTPGVTPTTPAFDLWRISGEGLTFTPETSESSEFATGGRSQNPADVTGVTVSGDINFELSKFPALDAAIEGVLAGTYGECPLTGAPGGAIDNANRVTIGDDVHTYTVEKRVPNPGYTDGTFDIACAEAGAPGVTSVLTFSGGPITSSGVTVLDFVYDTVYTRRVFVPHLPGDSATDAGTAAAAALTDDPTFVATDNLDGTVDVSLAPGIGSEISSVGIRSGANKYFYQRYRGVTYSALNISIVPNQRITGSVSIVGGLPNLDELPLTGVTYVGAGDSAKFTAPEVVALSLGTMFSIGTHCWSTLDLVYDSENRGISCIGYLGEKEVVLGSLSVTLSGDVYFVNQDPLYSLLRNESIGNGYIVLTNADADVYRFDLFGVKITSGELTAAGTGEDLTIPLEMQPSPVAVCDDGGGNTWKASSIISLENTQPTLP